MPFWFDEEFENICRFGLRVKQTLFSKQSDYQKVEVLETEGFGRALVIDGLFMMSERDEYLYHEMLVHPVLTAAPCIENVLVVGGGDGGTIREVLSYPQVRKVTMVEIDGTVVEASKRWLEKIGAPWDDARLALVIADGLEYVKNGDPESVDVILMDHSDPVGPAKGLFNSAFYRDCKRLLRPGGTFCLQSESPLLQRDIFLEIFRELKRLYTGVFPFFGAVPLYGTGSWSWTAASDVLNPMLPIDARTAFQETRCRYYNREIHRGAFALPNDLKRLLVG